MYIRSYNVCDTCRQKLIRPSISNIHRRMMFTLFSVEAAKKCNICKMLKCCKWNKIEDQNHSRKKAYLILNISNKMIQYLTQTTN